MNSARLMKSDRLMSRIPFRRLRHCRMLGRGRLIQKRHGRHRLIFHYRHLDYFRAGLHGRRHFNHGSKGGLKLAFALICDCRLRFQLDQFARVMRRARLVVVNSPSNPAGGTIAPEDLEQIAWWAERRDALILSDEVFARYQYEGDPISIGTLAKARRRTLTVGSISKEYALASARVGWLVGHRHLVRPCALAAALHTPFVPTLCQQIALAALKQPEEAFRPIRAQLDSRRHYAFERLQALGLKPAWPAGSFFLWVPVTGLAASGRAFARQLLTEKKVLVSPGDLFGPSGLNHIRISYATDDGRLREGLSRFVDFVRGKQGARTQDLRRAA